MEMWILFSLLPLQPSGSGRNSRRPCEGARPYATFKTTLEELLPSFSGATAENRWR